MTIAQIRDSVNLLKDHLKDYRIKTIDRYGFSLTCHYLDGTCLEFFSEDVLQEVYRLQLEGKFRGVLPDKVVPPAVPSKN